MRERRKRGLESVENRSVISSRHLFQPENVLKIKERQILSKMHFKPIGSSAVDELLKLTDCKTPATI